jgi:DNA-binding transcriptional ArsR family regulator
MVNAVRKVKDVEKPAAAEPVTPPAPSDVLTITDLDTLRLLADPLRMRVMSAFGDAKGAALTVKQLAIQLGVGPTRLYYHVNLLEERGLLRVVSSRVVSGIIEKSYAAAAKSITVDAALVRVSPAGRAAGAATVAALLQATADEAAEAFEIGAAHSDRDELRQMRIGKAVTRLTPEAHAEFSKRLNELVDEFEERYGSADGEPNRALLVAYYPLSTQKHE